ncbi:MAG: hypothetical protein AAFX54_07005 [Pseudomonadota bacterium]
MSIFRLGAAFIASSAITYTLASAFYTQQVLAKQAAIGAVYTAGQQAATYFDNFLGLAPAYGAVLTAALLIGFVVAAFVKRVLKPLAPVAYPVAGAAAVFTAIWSIENLVAGGGVGAMGGARDGLGVALQCLAGGIGGSVFAVTRGGAR